MSRMLKALAWVAPRAAMARARALVALDANRAYDGARRDRRTGGWDARSGSPNTAIAHALDALRDRSHDLVRNTSIGTRTLDVKVAHVVGTGIVMKAATGSDRDDRRLDELFGEWAETCDVEGQLDLPGLQALAVRAMYEGGDSVTRFVPRRIGQGRRVPLALQVLEGAHIDTMRDVMSEGRRTRLGVALGEWGIREGLWLFPEHPSEWISGAILNGGVPLLSRFVPAADVAHLYRADRPGQLRGVPIFAPILMDAKDLADLREAMIVKARVESCFGAFVTSTGAARTLADVKQDATDPRRSIEALSPGMISYLDEGETVTFAQPTSSGQFPEVNLTTAMSTAAGVGITHDELTGDVRQANYSSMRAGRIINRRITEQDQWLTVVPRLLRPIGRRFIETAVMAGLLRPKPSWRFEYVMPAAEIIDPKKDLEADVAAVRAGRMSPQQFIQGWGQDWRKVIADTEAFFAEADQRKIVLDIDPRRVTQTGIAQQVPATTVPADSAAGQPET